MILSCKQHKVSDVKYFKHVLVFTLCVIAQLNMSVMLRGYYFPMDLVPVYLPHPNEDSSKGKSDIVNVTHTKLTMNTILCTVFILQGESCIWRRLIHLLIKNLKTSERVSRNSKIR